MRALQSADVILIDDLVAPAILDFARREAKKMMVGKTGHAPSCKQDEINALMVSLARAGKRVVRLKGGDPMIFGRAGEEIAACRAAGIAVEVVPGISAAQGAASRLGISLTQRGRCAAGAVCHRPWRNGRLAARHRLAKPRRPGRHHRRLHAGEDAGRARRQAIARGLDPATPAVAIADATRPDEMVIAAPIASLPAQLAELPRGPVIVMIGRVFAEAAGSRHPELHRPRTGETPAVLPARAAARQR